MSAPTTLQADALRCFRNQLTITNDELKKLAARRRSFEFALLDAQKRVAALIEAASLEDAEILALTVAERRVNFIISFLSQSAPEVTRQELFILDLLNKFGALFSQIRPGALDKPASLLPVWAGESCGVADRAAFAVAEISKLLE